MTLVLLLEMRRSCFNHGRRKLFSRGCPALRRKPEPFPHIHQGLGESIHQRIVVVGAWRDPEPLCSALRDQKAFLYRASASRLP